ncbi:MFS transporter [Kutzneria buriramensis]|uniref:Putative MFS family arabinose efflux permease n=1 Tax=Kutzneria buriramensis TaxID=1045776 RepID=A0A3E0H2G3_9PSEU|nr:MFS transporter [Kutzneria buriramensis]REH37070.1 putative MFS family arabinose efflux permease [Kutzneria buriramensis]
MTTDLAARPALLSRALLLRFVSIFGASVGFALPLSVVPLYAKQSGAGFVTVALLLATVACELVTPALIRVVGYRWSLALGLILLGAPTFLLTVGNDMWLIVAVNIVRGAGFAIAVVAGGAVTAVLIPSERRGEGLAVVGLVSGVPSMLALPAGVWAAARWGFDPVFIATGVAPLLALLSLPGLPRKAPVREPHSLVDGLRHAPIMRPATIFAVSTAATGVLVTFLPLATAPGIAAAALLAQPAAATATRLIAGRLGDRFGAGRLLGPGILLTAIGMAAIAMTDSPAAVIGGALVFGAGFGVMQNASQALMYARVPAGGEGSVSAIWNAAYDLGMAAGALAAGLVVAEVGYPAIFLLTAAATLPALALVRRDRRP